MRLALLQECNRKGRGVTSNGNILPYDGFEFIEHLSLDREILVNALNDKSTGFEKGNRVADG